MSLSVQGLSVDLAKKRIVHDVNLEVPSGSFVGLLGPNGGGKSTVLKALYRLHRPASGTIRLDGADLLAIPPRAAARRIAVVEQECVVEFDFTVSEMVMIGRTPHQGMLGSVAARDREVVAQAMQRTGCEQFADRRFNSLSGGEKQLVLIARALAQGADHLILDEPTNHLDIRYQVEVLELVSALGMTVLAAIHDLSLASLFCDTVYVLAGGRIVADGAPREVITTELVRDVFGIDVLVAEHPETKTPYLLPRRNPLVRGGQQHVPSSYIN